MAVRLWPASRAGNSRHYLVNAFVMTLWYSSVCATLADQCALVMLRSSDALRSLRRLLSLFPLSACQLQTYEAAHEQPLCECQDTCTWGLVIDSAMACSFRDVAADATRMRGPSVRRETATCGCSAGLKAVDRAHICHSSRAS